MGLGDARAKRHEWVKGIKDGCGRCKETKGKERDEARS